LRAVAPGRLKESAKQFAIRIRNLSPSRSLIVHHGDADGLCGAAILGTTLEKIGCQPRLVCLEKLFPEVLREIHSGENDLVSYVDLGSPHVNRISEANPKKKPVLVIDHHDSEETEDTSIMNFNPELYGLSGESEASGSTMAYVISRQIEASAQRFSAIALIGSAELPGDLVGINLEVFKEAIKHDLAKLSKSGRGKSIQIRLGESWINRHKASSILTALGSVGYYRDGPLLATSSLLTGLSEATVQLAQKMELQRKAAFDSMLSTIRKKGLMKSGNLQWVEVGSSFKGMGSKVIGTFLSILKYSKVVNPWKYLLGFMELEPTVPGLGMLKGTWTKVSGRVPPSLEALINRGERQEISNIMMMAAEEVGGFADGHAYAASGVIPRGSEEAFIRLLDESVSGSRTNS